MSLFITFIILYFSFPFLFLHVQALVARKLCISFNLYSTAQRTEEYLK